MNQGNIPPEVMQAYMQQLTLEEQDQDFQHQMALAQQMKQQGPERYGPIGQGLQTIADLMNAYKGGQAQQSAHAGRAALRPQRQAGREAIGQNWLESQNPQPQPPMEAAIPDAAPGLEMFGGPQEPDLIPDLLRAPPPQMPQPPPSPASGDLNVGVAPVPPPLHPGVKAEPLADYKKRHQRG
jgi:hypothetical protein